MRILDQSYVCLFVRLFVEGLSSYSRIFHSYGDASITGEGLQMLTYSRHFFSVPHLLLHEASVSNGHLRGPLTLTPIAERLTVELKIPILTTYVCSDWDSNSQPSACRANA